MATWLAVGLVAQDRTDGDDFARLAAINQASLVVLAEQGLLDGPLAARIARGIARVAAEQAAPGRLLGLRG